MMVGLLGHEPERLPTESGRYGVRIIEPICDAMGIPHHLISQDADVGQDQAGDRQGLYRVVAGRDAGRTEAVMMNRDECFEILKRHITDEVVVASYSGAVEWNDLNPRDAQLLLERRDGARLLACARASRSGGRTGASSCSTATAAC